MAGKKVKWSLSGSSLVEVVIAMVIIILVFTIALTIITNVTRSSLSVTKAAAEKILDKAIADAERANDIASQKNLIKTDGFMISREISPYGSNLSLAMIELSAFSDNGDTILTVRKVLRRE